MSGFPPQIFSGAAPDLLSINNSERQGLSPTSGVLSCCPTQTRGHTVLESFNPQRLTMHEPSVDNEMARLVRVLRFAQIPLRFVAEVVQCPHQFL